MGTSPSLLQPLVSPPVPCPLELGEATWRTLEEAGARGKPGGRLRGRVEFWEVGCKGWLWPVWQKI